MDGIAQNILHIRERIAAAAQRIGRSADDVLLLAVTKTVAPERVDQALREGITTVGESKLQEAKQKIPLVSSRAHWHMIGHLQTNKARDAVGLFELIHSVDSVKLATEINKWAERVGKTQRILLEVNLSGESSKYGLKPDELNAALEHIAALERIQVEGLMTVPPIAEDAGKVRPYFQQLRDLREAAARKYNLVLPHLSMGMTSDFEVAVEEGSSIVRIGTAIFGERKRHEPEE